MIESITSEIAKDKDKYIRKICDNVNLKEGLHIKINIDDDFNEDTVKFYFAGNKNDSSNTIDIEQMDELKEYFKYRQLLSGLMNDDANKALDTPKKKSLGTVYLSPAFSNECSPYNENTKGDKKFKSSEEMIYHFQNIVYKKLENIGDEIEKTFKIDVLQRTLEKENKKLLKEEEKLRNLETKLKENKEKLSLLKEKDLTNIKTIKQQENVKKQLDKYIIQEEKFKAIKNTIENLSDEELAYTDIKNIINDARQEERKKQVCLCSEYLENNLNKILMFAKDKLGNKKLLIKIYFYSELKKIDDSLNEYNKEYNFYLINYIFNSGTIEIINEELKGAISYGYNNSGNKPFLVTKTCGLNSVKMHSLEEAMNAKLTNELLKLLSDSNSAKSFVLNTINETDITMGKGYSEKKNYDTSSGNEILKLHFKEKYIEDYDIRGIYKSNIITMFNEKIICKNILRKNKLFRLNKDDNKKDNLEYSIAFLISKLIFIKVDSLSKYNKYEMSAPFFREKGALNYENNASIVFEKYKYKIHDFLNDVAVNENDKKYILNKFTDECIEIYVNNLYMSDNSILNLGTLLNIKLNLLINLEKENYILKALENIKIKNEKLVGNISNFTIENDEEFYFYLGQAAYFIEYQSNAKSNSNLDVVKYYTEKINPKALKDYLLDRFKTYSFKISKKDLIFKKIFGEILLYEPKEKINKRNIEFYIGVCHDNIFLSNKKEDINEEEVIKDGQ